MKVNKIFGICVLSAVMVFSMAGCATSSGSANKYPFDGTYEKFKDELIISGEGPVYEFLYKEKGENKTKGILALEVNVKITMIDQYEWSGSEWIEIDPVTATYSYSWFTAKGQLSLRGSGNSLMEGLWGMPGIYVARPQETKPAPEEVAAAPQQTANAKKSNVEIEPLVGFAWFPLSSFNIWLRDYAGTRIGEEGKGSYDMNTAFNFVNFYQLGLNFFDKVGASLNLNIDDPTFQRLTQIAGAIDAKHFGLRFDYHQAKGTTHWYGDKLDLGGAYSSYEPPGYDYEMNSTMVILFYKMSMPQEILLDDTKLGIFWIRIDGQKEPRLSLSYSGGEPEIIASIDDREVSDSYGIYYNKNFGDNREFQWDGGFFLWANMAVAVGWPFYLMGQANFGIAQDISIGRRSTISWWFGIEYKTEIMQETNDGFGPVFMLSARL